jgi:hypothetical protein
MAPNRLKFAFCRLQLHEFVKYTILLSCIPILRVKKHIYLQPKFGWVKVWTPKTFKKGPKPPLDVLNPPHFGSNTAYFLSREFFIAYSNFARL